MEPLLLAQIERFPDDDLLRKALGATFAGYAAVRDALAVKGCRIEWRYYRDGRAWMGKLLKGQRNLGWVHVYPGFFTITCYFSPKHRDAVLAAPLPESLKLLFRNGDPRHVCSLWSCVWRTRRRRSPPLRCSHSRAA